jgi:hypothetical protein
MQSAAAPGPGLETPWWKKIGYYLWLLAIGAIVYAYVFATSASASSDTGIEPTQDPATGATTINAGNQVSLLLGCILIYMIFVKLWSNGQYQIPDGVKWIAPVVNALITFGLLIGLVFVSFRSTQSDSILRASTAADSKGFFGSNITLIGLTVVAVVVSIVMALRDGGDLYTSIFNVFKTSSQFVINFWFPLVMMYYLIRNDTNYWVQIVAGVSLSVAILMMCYDWWKVSTHAVPITPVGETFKHMGKDLWNTFPIAPYLKYVENTDLMEVAKRVMTFALLCYVAYLMISVYKFKHALVPCAGTDFASCFRSSSGFPNFSNTFFAGDKSNADDSSKNTTPYVNALWWTLMISVGVNALNWIVQQFSVYNGMNDWVNGTTTPTPAANMTTAEKVAQLLKLVVFPFYWIFSLFAKYPMATLTAFIAFAAIGLLLYRSSFDITEFIEGQRGTVITLFTMFIASLVMFGAYIYMNSPTADIVQDTMTYGQFIGKTGMVIAIAVCIVGLLLYFLNSHSKLSTITSIVEFGITAMIYIAGIAIVVGLARTMFSTSRKMGDSMFQVSADSNWVINVLKLLGNLLFYLPCLLLDFVDMLKEQYKLTTHTMLILLAMEAAFILAGHLLPSAVAKVINHTGVQILSAPISMNPSTKISTYDIQFVNAHGVEDTPVPTADPNGGVATATVRLKNYSYGVSAWFYIHPQPPNTNTNYSNDYINLLQFGPFGPSMQYNPINNAMQFNLYGKPINTLDNKILEVSDIPLQTWNNVVINSDKGAVDIFVNNKLIYTGTDLPENQTYASSIYNVTVGQEDGVNGEMCNIVLNTAPFTKPEIVWLYKTNRVLNPPVVGINMDPLNQGDAASYLATEAVDKDAPKPTPMPTFSTYGARTYGIIGAVLGAIFGWLFNHESQLESVKGLLMGAVVFGLIGALLGALFSTDGTVAYVLKTVANVFVDTF